MHLQICDEMNLDCVMKHPNYVVEKTVWRALGGHVIFLCRVHSPNGPMYRTVWETVPTSKMERFLLESAQGHRLRDMG